MKIAVIKGGNNITFSQHNSTAGNADILYALRCIGPKNHEITIVTHQTRNTFIPDVLKFRELLDDSLDLDEFDLILLFNFSINFFGGAESPSLTQLYKKLARSKTPIAYVQTDGQLPFRKFWPYVDGREWAKDYNQSDYEIDPSRIHYITQGYNIPRVTNELLEEKNVIMPHSITHFPWASTILTDVDKFFEKPNFAEVPARNYHLAYGGAPRNSYRKNLVRSYYCNYGILKVLLFGGISTGIPNTELLNTIGKVSFQQFIPTMKLAMATIIVGDRFYENNYFTLRMYESILAGCIVLIHEPFDKEHKFYNTYNYLKEFYVNGPNTVADFFKIYSSDSDRITAAQTCYNVILNNHESYQQSRNINEILENIANGKT